MAIEHQDVGFTLFCHFSCERVTNIPKESGKISTTHQRMSAGIVHVALQHHCIMKFMLWRVSCRIAYFSCLAGYFNVLAVVLRTSDESPWTNEFDSKS